MATPTKTATDIWKGEPPEYHVATHNRRAPKKSSGPLMTTRAEGRIGALMAIGGIAWSARVFQLSGLESLLMTSGPLHIFGIGTLIWIHAKWRRSLTA